MYTINACSSVYLPLEAVNHVPVQYEAKWHAKYRTRYNMSKKPADSNRIEEHDSSSFLHQILHHVA